MREKPKLNSRIERFAGSLAGALDMPETALGDVPAIELNSNTEAVIDGCRGILEYSDCCIRVATGRMDIKITGMDLQLKCMTVDSAIINGTIATVEFLSEAEG